MAAFALMNAADSSATWPQLAAAFASLPLPVALIDLETTGGHFDHDRITEVALLRFAGGQISRHQWLVNPQQPISSFITRLTGISNDMVADAPTFGELASQLLPLLRGHLLVAHNSRFDYTFLQRELARCGLPFATPTLCTVQLSRKLYPEYFKHNLDSLIERFDLKPHGDGRHRAMTDVLVLAQFLELSLQQHAEHWLAQCQNLIRPCCLPAWLPAAVRQQLYALPDTPGISLWQHPGHAQAQLQWHEAAFTDIGHLLHRAGAADRWRDTRSVSFMPAASLLHAHALAGNHPAAPPAEAASQAWYTVQWMADDHGRLQARIVKLDNGCRPQRPYGLFAHPRAAKKALAEWARQHRLCPAALDILPTSLPATAPCPLAAASQCHGHCRDAEHITEHNRRVQAAAPLLPVCDWGQRHEIWLEEHHPVNGCHAHLHCAAGAIALAHGGWYFHETLPRLFKQRFRQPRGIQVVC